MNQSNLVTSRDRIFLCTPRFAIQHAVASLLHGYLDQFLQQRVVGMQTRFSRFSLDGVFDNHRRGSSAGIKSFTTYGRGG